ncbi:MAG: SCP2 sterol-binding domain-containing protein [Deltaproteobacteria bacterium]|jgi:putative sterol carrier protein|nr:SCP2 sterol-binding domain-containing protein [Deltaproteobacteria bacterium]
MALSFPSIEWVEEFKKQINLSEGYKKAGATWAAGAVALVTSAKPEIGIKEDVGIWLDLHQGVCRDAKIVTAEESQKAPFCITGDYARWKQVIKKELEPVKGMMQGKLKLKGDLPTIVRYIKASQELVECTTRIETKFLDE